MTPQLDEKAPQPAQPRPGSSPFRALLLLLALDMAVGLWLKLHKPEALPLFVVVNAPTVGVLGFFWPLLPRETKDGIGCVPTGASGGDMYNARSAVFQLEHADDDPAHAAGG